jgi:LysR family cys regulon transcriptional activator
VHLVAPQIDRRDLRRVLEGNLEADWPPPPSWQDLSQPITF